MGKSMEVSQQAAGQQDVALGIVLDLDETAFNGRKILYDVCQNAVSQKKLELTQGLFCRWFLDSPLEEALTKLAAAQAKKITVDKLAAEIRTQYAKLMTAESNAPDPDLVALVAEAASRKIAIGALSFLLEENAQILLKRLVPDGSASLFVVKAGSAMTREGWLRLAELIRVRARCCLALTGCAAACRTALAAGMRCAVGTNEFTEFQDFAGADLVAESVKALGPKNLIALLLSRSSAFRQK